MRMTASRLGCLLACLPLLAPVGSSAAAHAATVIACVDPKATIVLSSPDTLARHSARWRELVLRRGRCFRIEPGTRWQPLFDRDGLVLMRRTPPKPGMPPLYFRTAPGAADAMRPDAVTKAGILQAGTPQAGALVRRSGPGTEITEQTLPPPAAAPAPEIGVPPVSVAAPPVPAAIAPPPSLPPDPAPVAVSAAQQAPVVARRPEADVSRRGYAFGFAVAVLLIILLLAAAALLLRLLLRRTAKLGEAGAVAMPLQPAFVRPARAEAAAVERAFGPTASAPVRLHRAGLFPGPVWLAREHARAGRRCADLLREAGWQATLRPSPQGCVVARRGGRILTLRCLPAAANVDEDAIEQACMTRERERADAAAIVCEAPVTASARDLAAHTGISLLRPDQIGSFARSSGSVKPG